MIRSLMFVSALALTAPAFAEQTTTPQEPATESTATQPAAEAQTPASSDPAAATPAPATTTAAATPAPATNPAANVAAVIETDWGSFDSDKNGELSKTEFAAWMTKLREAQPNPTTADAKAWTDAAFAQADADKSSTVSKGELTTFLQG